MGCSLCCKNGNLLLERVQNQEAHQNHQVIQVNPENVQAKISQNDLLKQFKGQYIIKNQDQIVYQKRFIIYNNFAVVELLEQMKQYEDAIQFYDQAIYYNRCFFDLYTNKAYLLLRIGNIEEALKCFQQGIQTLPQDCNLYYYLLIILLLVLLIKRQIKNLQIQ